MLADIVPPATTEEEAGYLAGRSRFGKSLSFQSAISHIGLREQYKGLMVKWMRGMGAVGEIWIWRKALTMGLAGR